VSSVGAFTWYELRTTDVAAARAFYAEVAGWQVDAGTFRAGANAAAGLLELPERARAQGAPAHWLGHVAVPDVEAAARAWIERGGQALGPVQRAPGGDLAIVRDAQGAVLALGSRPEASTPGAVAWHELHTTDVEAAWAMYAERFGWTRTELLDLGPEVGPYAMFAWRGGAPSVGGIVGTARAPEVHTHWLFYLTVPDLDASLAAVRALGGRPYSGPHRAPSGDRVAACEDGQGAVFGLRERGADAAR
jgi:hypothetical protein